MFPITQSTNLFTNYSYPQHVSLSYPGQQCSAPITESMLQKHYDDFYEEVFYEIESKYGEIEEMNVCENLGDHIVGNVYIKFYKEEDAEKAQDALNERWFGGEAVAAELSPVTNFREACC